MFVEYNGVFCVHVSMEKLEKNSWMDHPTSQLARDLNAGKLTLKRLSFEHIFKVMGPMNEMK